MSLKSNLKSNIPLFLIVGIAVILRLLYIDRPAFWHDECTKILMAGRISFTSPLPLLPFKDELFTDHPPLIMWVLFPFVKAFGVNEFFLRLPSVLFGIGTVVITYFFGRLLANQFVGILSSLLLALLPFHIVYSQQATNYSALLFFFVFSLYLFSRNALKSERKTLYTSAAVTTLGLFTHYLAVLIYPIEFASLILSEKRKMILDWHVWVSWIMSIIPFLLWIFLAPESLRHLSRTPLLEEATRTPLIYYATILNELFSYPLVIMTIFYCILFKMPLKMTYKKSLITSWLVVTFLFLFFGLSIYDERYALPVAPPILLSCALFLSEINSSSKGAKTENKRKLNGDKALLMSFLVVLLIVSVIFGTSPNYVYPARNQMWWMKANWRDASHYLLVNHQVNDLVYSTSFIAVRLYTGLKVESIGDGAELTTSLQTSMTRVWFLIDKTDEGQLDSHFLTFLKEECLLKYVATSRTVEVYLFERS